MGLRLLVAAAGVAALGLAVSALAKSEARPRADFVLANGNEPESLDPALASGTPEARVARALFEGLVVLDPATLEPRPGAARWWTLSDDGLTWTFELQPGGRWSDGTPVVAQDFQDSLLRVLAPATGARSSNILFDVRGARAFARPAKGVPRPDASTVGIRATGERTLLIELERRSPAFLQILALPAFSPVNLASIRRHGAAWTRAGNLVSNGPFRLAERLVRDRLSLVRNEHYWDRAHVTLASMDILAATSLNTLVNLYFSGDADWVTDVPSSLVEAIRRDHPADLRTRPFLGTYFYRINTKHAVLGNAKVRAALALALDRRKIVATALKAGEAPATALVPALGGWVTAVHEDFDPARARALLAEGLGELGLPALPPFEVLYNTAELHEAIAELVQIEWQRNLGVTCRLARQDWAAARAAIKDLDYSVSRGVWLADYADPATFLDVFTSTSVNNQTGFSSTRYDALVEVEARNASSDAARMATLAEAERTLMDAHPIIPIFHYVTCNLVRPDVTGFHENALDVHFPKFLSRHP